MPLYYPPTAISAGTQSTAGNPVVWSNSNGVSFGMSNNSVVTASVSGLVSFSFHNFNFGQELVAGQIGQASLHLQPWNSPTVQFDRIAMPMHWSNASNSSFSQTLSFWVGIYTKNGSSLSLLSSTSQSTNFSASGTVGSYSLYGGPRNLTIGWTQTMEASGYWLGVVSRTTTGGGAGASISQFLASFMNSSWSGEVGVASATSKQMILGLGVYSASTSGMPNAIHFSEIVGQSSIVLRPPAICFRSGTL